MKEFWETRYAASDYAYGKEPNDFFRQWIDRLEPGKIYLPGEGEGRNAVYAAGKGWEVHAFDQSENARKKAIKLAAEKGVELNYLTGYLDDIMIGGEEYDLIAVVYFHLLPEHRRAFHHRLVNMLKPGGILLMEAFSKTQINYKTGGPANVEMLYTKQDVLEDLKELEVLHAFSGEISLNEGQYHQGPAHVIRFTGRK